MCLPHILCGRRVAKLKAPGICAVRPSRAESAATVFLLLLVKRKEVCARNTLREREKKCKKLSLERERKAFYYNPARAISLLSIGGTEYEIEFQMMRRIVLKEHKDRETLKPPRNKIKNVKRWLIL